MYAVDELRQAGFEVWTESGKIRYKQVNEGQVDSTWVNNLLQNIKEHKQVAIRYLQEPAPPPDPASPVPDPAPSIVQEPTPTTLEDRLMTMYTAKLGAIAKIYHESGADFDWLKVNHSAIYHTVNKSEDKLNKIWLRCLKGDATMQDFEWALTDWWTSNMKGIRLSISKQADQKEQLALW